VRSSYQRDENLHGKVVPYLPIFNELALFDVSLGVTKPVSSLTCQEDAYACCFFQWGDMLLPKVIQQVL